MHAKLHTYIGFEHLWNDKRKVDPAVFLVHTK